MRKIGGADQGSSRMKAIFAVLPMEDRRAHPIATKDTRSCYLTMDCPISVFMICATHTLPY